jgi:two-component system, cell cycle response regulator
VQPSRPGGDGTRGRRVRLALYVAATVFLPLIALGFLIIELSDADEASVYRRIVVLAAATAGAVTYLSIRLTLRSTTSAIAAVSERARAVSAGHIGRFEPVPEDGPRETAELARAFNEMFARVREYVDELERSQHEFRRAISRLGDAFASTHDRETIMEVAVEASALVVGARAAVFWVNEGNELRAARAYGEARIREPIAVGEGLAGAVAADGWPRIGQPEQRAPAEPHLEFGMAVPVVSEGKRFGVLGVYGRSTDLDYDADDLAALRSLARQAEAAIVNTFLHEEAQRLSVTDGLTGLTNRREFERRANEELERSGRFSEPFSIVLADLDAFKQVNDTYGHAAGDAVLIEVSRRLAEATREVDVVARLGGEELAALLPRTDLQGGMELARKLRAAVAASPVRFQGKDLAISASFGVSSYPECGIDVSTLLQAADAALYRAKEAGKNRVEPAAVAVLASRPRRRRTSRGRS